jgi:hypothetical protein
MPDTPELVLRVVVPDGDAADRARSAQRLRTSLLLLDVSAVTPVEDAAVPAGAKGTGAVGGVLGVVLGKVGLPQLVAKVREWVSRSGHVVEITLGGDTIKVVGPTAEQQDELIRTWLARHAVQP